MEIGNCINKQDGGHSVQNDCVAAQTELKNALASTITAAFEVSYTYDQVGCLKCIIKLPVSS